MEHSKIILLFVLFLVTGGVFVTAGIYFSTEKFLAGLQGKRAAGKRIAALALTVGLVTIGTGTLLFVFPAAVYVCILLYLCFLIGCAAVILIGRKR